MLKRSLMAAAKWIATAMVLAFAGSAPAQESELAKIRDEIQQMKQTYERRIESLEKRLAEAEFKAGKAEQSAAAAEAAATSATVPLSGRSGEGAFNPAISMVLQGTYARTSRDPNAYSITGFMPSGGEVGPPKRSFGLGETELNIAANIDPYFRGVAIASLAPDGGVSMEEAYFQTLAMPYGFKIKGGRFFSGIGYQNEQHQHAWDFQDAPLVYKAFLGGQLKQDGLQIKWVAPTDLFMEAGAEFSAGDSFPGGNRNKNGVGGGALFGNAGGDIGVSTAWRAGLSYMQTASAARSYQDTDMLGGAVTNTFSGSAKLLGLNGVVKWSPNGNATYRNVKLQGEYFRLKQDGVLTYDDSAQAAPQFGAPLSNRFSAAQSGWYAQAIWQFMPRWRAGYRYDALTPGRVSNGIVSSGAGPVAADFPLLAHYSPSRNTLMFDWSPTEFSRLRLQLAADKSRMGVTDNQVFLQYIYSLGAHGAHQF
jgi:hypothetical protein